MFMALKIGSYPGRITPDVLLSMSLINSFGLGTDDVYSKSSSHVPHGFLGPVAVVHCARHTVLVKMTMAVYAIQLLCPCISQQLPDASKFDWSTAFPGRK